MQIAAQFYTLRGFTRTLGDLDAALARVREIGYTSVQLSAVACLWGDSPDATPEQVRAALDANGVRCLATHRPWSALTGQIEAELDVHHTLGATYTAPGAIVHELGQAPESYSRFLEQFSQIADRYAAGGLEIGYHNHDWEFVRDPATGKAAYERLVQGDRRLQLEVDTYWVARAGAEPSELLARCAGRIRMIHAKDCEVVPGEGPVMAPVGEGNLNWTGILAACQSGGTEAIIVEQDVCRRDPFDCLQSSFDYLSARLSGSRP
jgi:sugar phosphate isomerase/epimerase